MSTKLTLFTRQLQHVLALCLLLAALWFFLDEMALRGAWLGLTTPIWLLIAILVPIAHQLYVWYIWRQQLLFGNIAKWWGANGFFIYTIGFTILFVSRLLVIIGLAVANRNTLAMPPLLAYGVAVLCLLPALYLFYSVRTYFGFKRAYGIDHFDPSYRTMPFVRGGIFRFTSNAMYVFGFLILWVPGFLLLSKAALLAAAFNHLYIWVHYYCTELPDIRYIYGHPSDSNGADSNGADSNGATTHSECST